MVEQSNYSSLIQNLPSELDKTLFFLHLSALISPFNCLYLKMAMTLFCLLFPWKSGRNYNISSPPPVDKNGKSFQYILILPKAIMSFYQSLADSV